MSNFYYNNDIKLEELVSGKNYRKILAHDGNLMLVEVYFENAAIGETHTHPHEQSVYCLEGEFEFTAGSETNIIKSGDTIYFPPNMPHGCKLLSKKGKLLDIFSPQREDFLDK